MSKKTPTVVAVMPAYNAATTLKKTVKDIPPGVVDKIILVDDGSSDETVRVAKSLGLEVVTHPQNRGYGGNQKTCYTTAISEGARVIVMIHPDYQYDSSLAGEMVRPILEGRVDIMLGSRIRTRAEALAGGMPAYKYSGNRLLTLLENMVLGLNLSEYHTGYRAFSADILRKIPFHRYSDDFVFDQHILFGAVAHGARIGEIAVPVRYFPEASSINFVRSCQYGLAILWGLAQQLFLGGRAFR
jgi:glycosyltransferase involved in cell wall biosynthesis